MRGARALTGAGLACLGLGAALPPAAAEAPPVLRIGVRHDATSPASVRTGIRFGADEMAHTAHLVGREVQVVSSDDAGAVDARIETSSNEVSISAAPPRVIAGGITCRLQLRPDDEERGALLNRWRDSVTTPDPAAVVVEWHPTLTRFGAAQLNERFVRATATPMDAAAWTGWLAVKALAEALLRSTGTDLCSTLRRQALDGHKGEPLRFDDASGRLRQPLYVATPTRVLAGLGGS